ncbi:hypothetical protein HRbin16_02534 [bacterium HR16]|nr:hypothetical protein HRbin16_02534 [bacterium HR16]
MARTGKDNAQRNLQRSLIEAAGRGDAREVKRLLQQGARANCRVLYGAEPLPIVAWVYMQWESLQCENPDEAEARFADYAETVRTLVQAGAPVDARDSLGNTTLMEAALSGHTCWIRLLLRLGANPNAANDHYRETPLTAASQLAPPEAVWNLLQAGANVTSLPMMVFLP